MKIITGGVYYVADGKITLPPESKRNRHEERRPFVVISSQTSNSDPDWQLVLGCPISGSTKQRTKLCVKVEKGEANLTKKSWIRVPAIQPLEKSSLEDLLGTLSEESTIKLIGNILKYMDIDSFQLEGDGDGVALD